jgi:putative DNA primase/helicase
MATARTLTKVLGGKWYGSDGGYGYVCCVAHEDRRPSLRLRDGVNGKLLVHCAAGCDAKDVLLELRRRGLLANKHRTDQQSLRRQRKREERDRGEREAYAREIWHQSATAAGTPVETYLRARAITLAIPATLRYHRGLQHGPTGLMLPAMIAAVQAPDRSFTGIHRTFLKSDGSDKALVSEAKLSLGSVARGAVRLAAATTELAIGEGIETALSFMQEHGIPAWAALSTSGLRSIVLPPLPLAEIVHICVDMDANHAGERATEVAARRFAAEGRKVKIEKPLAGEDMNDALREAVRGAQKDR